MIIYVEMSKTHRIRRRTWQLTSINRKAVILWHNKANVSPKPTKIRPYEFLRITRFSLQPFVCDKTDWNMK